MKRAPIVLTGTACGLVAVIGYHAAVPQASSLTTGASASTGASTLNVGGATGSTASSSGTKSSSASSSADTSANTAATASNAQTTRSAVGSDVQFQYGDIAVKVTMTGSKVTDVTVAKADIYDQHSEQIDQYAIPELRAEALRAQSANIDGVSGASYTSAAYEQSLQSAIDKLKA
jgi:uncharacterized protein with FMN-binding domain